MTTIRRSGMILVLANALGIGLFLLVTSTFFWIEPELANEPGANGGAAVVWIVFAAPIGLIFMLVDLCWLAVALYRGSVSERLSAIALTLLLLTCWASAYAVDNMHHGI